MRRQCGVLVGIRLLDLGGAEGTSLASDWRTVNNCRTKLPTAVSDNDFGATIRWLTLTVSTLSSGRAGNGLKVLPGISSASYSGCFLASASETSIGRNFGSPLAFAVAAIASMVILLSSGPTAMKASIAGSRAISAIWLVANWVIATLSGLTPDSVRITRSRVTLVLVRPMTPTRCPARSPSLLDLRRRLLFRIPWPAGRQRAHSTTTFLRRMATDWALAGRSRSPRATARSAFLAASSAMLSIAPSVMIGAAGPRGCRG